MLQWMIRQAIRILAVVREILVIAAGWIPHLSKSSVFYVSGRYLRDNDREKVVLRGVNIPLLDDYGFPASNKLAQVEKSGANAVRIQWYAQYPDPTRPAFDLKNLDAFLDECRTKRLIPVLELHDCRCPSDAQLVNTQLMAWWTSTDVVKLLKRHERYLIINLANELGEYRWKGATPAALNHFRDAYKQAITSIRAKGLRMPIMIDAPDCGTSLHALTAVGQALIDHDPRHSLLLSAHAYWGEGYDGTAEVDRAFDANLPIVFGEIANKQFANDDECYYGLDGTGLNHPPPTGFSYQRLLVHLTQLEVGWFAWAWYKDKCEARRMTPDGNYTGAIDGSPTGLTPYGEDILHHATYGLRKGMFLPRKSSSLPGATPPPIVW